MKISEYLALDITEKSPMLHKIFNADGAGYLGNRGIGYIILGMKRRGYHCRIDTGIGDGLVGFYKGEDDVLNLESLIELPNLADAVQVAALVALGKLEVDEPVKMKENK